MVEMKLKLASRRSRDDSETSLEEMLEYLVVSMCFKLDSFSLIRN
jgi:hypothetical protein